MSMEASIASKSIPALVPQDAKATYEPPLIKPAQYSSPLPAGVKHPHKGTSAQTNQASPVGFRQHKPLPVAAGSGIQNGSISEKHSTGPSLNPVSGNPPSRHNLALASKQSEELPTLSTDPNQDEAESTTGDRNPEEELHKGTTLAGWITD